MYKAVDAPSQQTLRLHTSFRCRSIVGFGFDRAVHLHKMPRQSQRPGMVNARARDWDCSVHVAQA